MPVVPLALQGDEQVPGLAGARVGGHPGKGRTGFALEENASGGGYNVGGGGHSLVISKT
jgi:hypothetical protein